ncbi:MAG: hypothetical protein IT220_07515 [Flavobacteriaceae bacterium]|nr:hypothetical protein [Flavobacteriaceae bacterium]
MSNSGEDLLKMLIKGAWWVVKLIPGIIKGIYKGIKSMVGSTQAKTDL